MYVSTHIGFIFGFYDVDVDFKVPVALFFRQINQAYSGQFIKSKIVKKWHLESPESILYELEPPFFSNFMAYKLLKS